MTKILAYFAGKKFDDTDARGLTIDTVSCVNLIIAIGLCVDYSAHIAHRFLVKNYKKIFFFFITEVKVLSWQTVQGACTLKLFTAVIYRFL